MQEAMSYGSAALARRLRLRSVRSVVYACAGLGLLLAVVTISGTWGLPILRTVDVSVDGKDMTVHTFKRTVGGVLAAGGISLQADDRVTPAADTLVWPDMRVTVVRAVPFSVVVAGRSYPRRVAAETVGEALRTLGIRVGPIDKVYPGLQAALRPGARVTIERREWRTWVEYGAIPFGSAVVNDVSLFKGNTVVRSTGRVGTKERSVRVLYANGKPAMMEPRAWAVAQAPTPRVIAVGTRAMIASRGEFAGREYMMLEATAYYPGPNNFGGGVGPRTAIGMVAQRGIVAVDPSLIPLGSHLYIEGYGYAVAGDTGGSIRGRRIDLCYNSYGEAIQFGRREVKVYIIGGR